MSGKNLLKAGYSWKEEFYFGSNFTICEFANMIQDTNPIHHRTDAARKMGFRDIIAPGVMVMGVVSSTIAKELPCTQVRKLSIKFMNPVYAGNKILVRCTVIKEKGLIVEVAVNIRNTTYNYSIVAQGSCTIILPKT